MSAFWQRKMKTYFTRIDFDKDGSITRKDFEGMAARFTEHGKFEGDKAKDMADTLTAVWDKFLSAITHDGEGIPQDKFVTGMTKLVKDDTLRPTLEGPLPLFFHAVDLNNDGLISKEEYGEFFRVLGIDEKMAPASFTAIDTDNDGNLSLKEFTTAGADFFLSDDEKNPNQNFWGTLL